MTYKVTIFGAGKTGLQTVVKLLETIQIPVALYDDNSDFAQGMVLDIMQSTVLETSKSFVQALATKEETQGAELLLVCEGSSGVLDEAWMQSAKDATLVLLATQDTEALRKAYAAGLSKESVFSIHGYADKELLRMVAAEELGLARSDIQAMVYGGIGKDMETNPEYVRASGIPIEEIQKGCFPVILKKTRQRLAEFQANVWGQHYRLASAAAELVSSLASGVSQLVPVTGIDFTTPALLDKNGVRTWHEKLCKKDGE